MARRRFPEVSVKLALVAERKLLVLRTRDGGNDLPGGHLEYGESLLGALQREVQEEVGYALRARPRLWWVTNYFNPRDRKHHLLLVFRLTARRQPPLHPGPAARPLWLSATDIRRLTDNAGYKRKLLALLHGSHSQRLLRFPSEANLPLPRRSR